MFDGPDFPKPLDEQHFDSWLEEGRAHKIGYSYLLIVWDEFESKYIPVYAEHRAQIHEYEQYGSSGGQESLIAAYDLFSESRVSLQ